METVGITKVAILTDGRLAVYPATFSPWYEYIYREAAGVYWNLYVNLRATLLLVFPVGAGKRCSGGGRPRSIGEDEVVAGTGSLNSRLSLTLLALL